METLQAIYIALAVFGVGVTIVDLFGALDHGTDSGHQAGGHDHGGGPGHDGGLAADGHAGAGHDAVHDAAHDDGGRVTLLGGPRPESLRTYGAEERGVQVARIVSVLRTGVYFSLGAGPTGIAALAMKLGAFQSALWAAGAGVGIAILAKVLRKVVRHDLDSSFQAEDFILEEAEVTVPVAPGLMGRAVVRKFGAQAEVYVKATEPDRAFARGDLVRIVDFQESCYLVEAADAEHLVH